jgi:hypothetical protein
MARSWLESVVDAEVNRVGSLPALGTPPRPPLGVKRQQQDKMAARDSRKDCRLGSPLSLRERGLGVRVQSPLNQDFEVKDILSLTPALSRRERVVYISRLRLMPMPRPPLGLRPRPRRQRAVVAEHGTLPGFPSA